MFSAESLQREFPQVDVTVLDSKVSLCKYSQVDFLVQPQKLAEIPMKYFLHLAALAQVLLDGPVQAVQVEQASIPGLLKIISQTEVKELRSSFDKDWGQLRTLPKSRAQWLLPRIGRTGGREPSRSPHAHARQVRKNERSSRRR